MSANVNQHLDIETLEMKKKNSPILMKFKTCNSYGLRISHRKFEWSPPFGKKNCLRFHSNFMCEILRPEGFQILSFIKKNFFFIFSHFHLMLEDPQKFSTSNFSNFLVKNVKSSFTGSWQIPKGTKS